MSESRPTLMEDLERAGRESMPHLLGAIVSAVVSLLVPLAGIVAADDGHGTVVVRPAVRRLRRREPVVMVGVDLGSAPVLISTTARWCCERRFRRF